MKGSYEQQLKKGALELVVLKLIAEGPTYGYELISRLKESSGGTVVLKDGTLYPILYRLEDDGLVRTQWQTEEGRAKPKKMYTITPEGLETLPKLADAWYTFSGFVNDILRRV